MSGRAAFPHLKDTASVRAEAAAQYGPLGDAGALQEAHKAQQDPNSEAAALKRINADENEKVQGEAGLQLAQEKVDAEFGRGVFRVVAAAVRGDALSVVVEDTAGRTHHRALGWLPSWRRITRGPDAEAQAKTAQAEAASALAAATVNAEIERRMAEERVRLHAEMQAQFAEMKAAILSGDSPEVPRGAEKNVGSDAVEGSDAGGGQEDGAKVGDDGKVPASAGAEGESEAVPSSDEDGSAEGGDEPEAHYPRTQEALDELAAANGFAWPEGVSKVADKKAALAAAGIKPVAE